MSFYLASRESSRRTRSWGAWPGSGRWSWRRRSFSLASPTLLCAVNQLPTGDRVATGVGFAMSVVILRCACPVRLPLHTPCLISALSKNSKTIMGAGMSALPLAFVVRNEDKIFLTACCHSLDL